MAKFDTVGLPTTDDEVWRYAPLSEFNLEAFDRSDQDARTEVSPRAATWKSQLESDPNALVLTIHNGQITEGSPIHDGVTVSSTDAGADWGGVNPLDRYGDDGFSLLSLALSPQLVTIDISDDVVVPRPIYLISLVSGSFVAPSVRIRVGRRSRVQLIECLIGGDDALVLSRGEYEVADNASLAIATLQGLAASAWHIGRTTAIVGANASLRQSVVGLGAHYDRARNDAEYVGAGGTGALHTTYLGSGTQVHDFRTHQLHRVGRTRSTLLSKGAVAEQSRSIYTGLIEIEKGAKRTDARQTNHNLLLSKTAHADTVPNLDIKENDVVCQHASSVGPLDELQLWYLESRGVTPLDAERLLVQGFFAEMTDEMPDSIASLVLDEVGDALAAVGVTS